MEYFDDYNSNNPVKNVATSKNVRAQYGSLEKT